MNLNLIYTLFIIITFTACTVSHTSDRSVYSRPSYNKTQRLNSTKSQNALPPNLDPNKCFVRTITPDVYETYTEKHLTYTPVDANEYPHKPVNITVSPAVAKWEYQKYEGCSSPDPLDCQVMCYKKYPAEIKTIYIPVDTTLGNPYLRTVEIRELKKKGGVEYFEEIECTLLKPKPLPISFSPASAELSLASQTVIDAQILPILENQPNLKIEISSYTSSRGADKINLILSQKRAEAIVNYLQTKSIPVSLLTAKGYGESKLQNRCNDGVPCTDTEHAINERIEYRVVNH